MNICNKNKIFQDMSLIYFKTIVKKLFVTFCPFTGESVYDLDERL